MESLHLDAYTYSDSSAPRTPSPHDMSYHPGNNDGHYKHAVLDVEPRIYGTDPIPSEDGVYWHNGHSQSIGYNPRGSLLQELYEPEIPVEHHHHAMPPHLEIPPQHEQHSYPVEAWQQQQMQQQAQQPYQRGPDTYHMARRATFPYVRQDRDDGLQLHNYPSQFMPQQPYPPRQDTLYDSPHQEPYIPSMNSSPHPPYHEFDDTPIKLEDTSVMVPQQGFYRPPVAGDCHPMTMSYLSAHSGLPVQHTDDAASKETQYLRRRCFNCHTTEPPSWRRSTLNPGKIVCNKCGLYERTHLRPRPLRFDELRAGNKARKQSQSKGALSPKAKMALVKKEPREFGLIRRASVSSTSSTHSSSGASDWDDSLSVYSNGSNPPSSFNSPNPGTFPLSRDSQSPPHEGGIRLPNAPLSELASMQASSAGSSPQPPAMSPSRSQTAPAPYYSPQPGTITLTGDIYRRSSVSEVPVQSSPSLQPQDAGAWTQSITSSPQAPQPTELTIPAAPVDAEAVSRSPEVQVPVSAAVAASA